MLKIRTISEDNIDRFIYGNNLTPEQIIELICDISSLSRKQIKEWKKNGKTGQTISVDGDLTLTDGSVRNMFDYHLLIDPENKIVVLLKLTPRKLSQINYSNN